MTITERDLWPSAFGSIETELPDAILKEQASLLGDKTDHHVEARVAAPEHATYVADRIRLGFYLVAPNLGSYSFRLFTVEYAIRQTQGGITGYPVTLLDDVEHVCQDRTAFLEALREVFASQYTMQVISALMASSEKS